MATNANQPDGPAFFTIPKETCVDVYDIAAQVVGAVAAADGAVAGVAAYNGVNSFGQWACDGFPMPQQTQPSNWNIDKLGYDPAFGGPPAFQVPSTPQLPATHPMDLVGAQSDSRDSALATPCDGGQFDASSGLGLSSASSAGSFTSDVGTSASGGAGSGDGGGIG